MAKAILATLLKYKLCFFFSVCQNMEKCKSYINNKEDIQFALWVRQGIIVFIFLWFTKSVYVKQSMMQ